MSIAVATPGDAAAIAALEECFETGRWSRQAWAEEIASPRCRVLLQTDAAGNGVLTEDAIRCALEESAGDAAAIARALSAALGSAWDRELEPFRAAEEGDATIFELPRLSAG